ncbi:hypothetical protein [Cyanobium sp. ATX-6F1]|uniref:hypothetical protein n=1 Tax=Cyanobium sp. ATX-6F1 TaxID=3137388 RepID=UPI0039BECB4D
MVFQRSELLRSIAPHVVAAAGLLLAPLAAGAAPNGTWLSQPQIWFYTSTNGISQVMAQIRAVHYNVVFLDYRKVSDPMQQQVAQEARRQGLMPVVWVQSPQYRSLTIPDLLHEARNGDGIQVDDHFLQTTAWPISIGFVSSTPSRFSAVSSPSRLDWYLPAAAISSTCSATRRRHSNNVSKRPTDWGRWSACRRRTPFAIKRRWVHVCSIRFSGRGEQRG